MTITRDLTLGLTGGLGNQLFQYSFGQALLASNPRISLSYDLSSYRKHPNYFALGAQIFDQRSRIAQLFPHPLGRRHTVAVASRRLVNNKSTYVEPKTEKHGEPTTCRSLEAVSKDPRIGWVYGYFQSAEFALRASHSIRQLEVFSEIPSSRRDIIAIHVRRGDMLAQLTAGGVELTADYYEKATSLIQLKQETAQQMPIVVCTDDAEWATANIPFATEIRRDTTALEDLTFLATARYLVTSASTYSWWSTALNPEWPETVVCPSNLPPYVSPPPVGKHVIPV